MPASFSFGTGVMMGVATTSLIVGSAIYFETRHIRGLIADDARAGSLAICNRLQTNGARRDCYAGTLYLMETAANQFLVFLPIAGRDSSTQTDQLLEKIVSDQQTDQQAAEIRAVALQLSAAGKNPDQAQSVLKLVGMLAELTALPRNDLLTVALHAFTQNRVYGLDPQKYTETTAYLASVTSGRIAQADTLLTRTFENGYAGVVALNTAFPTFDNRQMNHFRDLADGGKQAELAAEALEGFRAKFSGLLAGAQATSVRLN